MLVTLICPGCRTQLEYESDQVDSAVVCSGCAKIITVSRTPAPISAPAARNPRLWQWLVAVQLALLLAAGYWLYRKSEQLRHMSQPVIVETNVVVTNLVTNVEVTTNVIVKSEPATNRVSTNSPAKIAAKTKPTYAGPKVEMKGYNIVPINGVKYAHAVVQNITPLVLKQVRVRFDELGVNRRGVYRVRSLTDSTNDLGPYQFWELRKAIDAKTVRIQLIDLTASE
jgi:hypothetical protein